MSKAYNDGYAQGYLSDEDLREIGHTPESYLEYVESTHRPDVYKPNFTKSAQEFSWGILDGANERAKKGDHNVHIF